MSAGAVTFSIDPAPQGKNKDCGGSRFDTWNDWLAGRIAGALPVDDQGRSEATTAILSGLMDVKPADPIEAVLAAQLLVASDAALSMYRRAWSQPPEYFAARTKYLALADKAARTAALLSERLDQHRGRGPQRIIVQHVTVNADQAVVADQVVTGSPASDRAKRGPQIAAGAEIPMELVTDKDGVPAVNGGGAEAK